MQQINLNELTLDHVGQWPNPVKISLLLGLSLLIIILGYWLFIEEDWSLYQRKKAQELVFKKDFEKKQHKRIHLSEYRQQVKELNDNFSLMLEQLSKPNEMTALLEEISKTGLACGLKFELFSPQLEVKKDFFVESPINISVVGSYVQISMFFSKLAAMKKLVIVDDFTLKKLSFRHFEEISEDQLFINMKLKIYQYSST